VGEAERSLVTDMNKRYLLGPCVESIGLVIDLSSISTDDEVEEANTWLGDLPT
jgi:hypothetical protein